MGINKVSFNGNTLIDLTEDTVVEDVLLEGYSAHDASGNIVIGTYSGLKLIYVETLPNIGEENCIYLIDNDEFFYAYVWQENNFKFIGDSQEDLSNFIKRSEVVDWTEEDLQKIWDSINGIDTGEGIAIVDVYTKAEADNRFVKQSDVQNWSAEDMESLWDSV